jgi:hypothetical protein
VGRAGAVTSVLATGKEQAAKSDRIKQAGMPDAILLIIVRQYTRSVQGTEVDRAEGAVYRRFGLC